MRTVDAAGTVGRIPRRPRIQIAGGIHHCTQHGIGNAAIFRSDQDRERFLWMLEDELVRSEWECLAYSLMRTHFHLLVRLRKETLSSGFQRLNSRYAQWFNHEYGQRGHFFERRFRDAMILTDWHRFEATRYIHLNAPAAGICERPEEYAWCDYGSTVGLFDRDRIVDPRKALDFFGADLREARRLYRQFVAERDPRVRRGQTRVRP